MGDIDRLSKYIQVARGEGETHLLLEGANLVNVYTGEIYPANVALFDELIVGVGPHYQNAHDRIPLHGRYILPGLIDAHIHLESTLLCPSEFARLALLAGTTTVVLDPHEIANVLGMGGIQYLLKATEKLPLNVFIMAPSCVPATSLETSGATITERDIAKLLEHERVLGLGEMMNFPQVVGAAPPVLKKLLAARRHRALIDGHSPGLRGAALQSYILAGAGSDHECTTRGEAREKLRLGMRIMVRQGSAAKNLMELAPLIKEGNSRRFLLVCDDLDPRDMLEHGHLNPLLRQLVALGVDPVEAIQMATINPAEYFGMARLGRIAPGMVADLVVLDDLIDFRVSKVFKSGRLVVDEGKLMVEPPPYTDPALTATVRMATLKPDDFALPARGRRARVIGLIPDQIITRGLHLPVKSTNGMIISDLKNDILKLVVIERHHRTGRIGLGLVNGFGLRSGALGSTVAHDSHNLVIAGVDDQDIQLAAETLAGMGGGLVVVSKGKILSLLALPIAGLITEEPATVVGKSLSHLTQCAHSLGVKLKNPFSTLSFLALPVIPQLRLTDQGLVDVDQFQIVPLWAE